MNLVICIVRYKGLDGYGGNQSRSADPVANGALVLSCDKDDRRCRLYLIETLRDHQVDDIFARFQQ